MPAAPVLRDRSQLQRRTDSAAPLRSVVRHYGAGSCSMSPTSVSSFPRQRPSLSTGPVSPAPIRCPLPEPRARLHTLVVPFNVGDYQISGTQTLSLAPGGQGTASLTITSSHSYSGKINATCDASALAGATCSLSPANPLNVTSGGTATLTATSSCPALQVRELTTSRSIPRTPRARPAIPPPWR